MRTPTFIRMLAVTALMLAIRPLAAQETKPVFKFGDGKKFKIVQFTDVHYGGPEKSMPTLEMMRDVIEEEKPDLVVFTGDVVVKGDEHRLWQEIGSVVSRNNTLYAVTLGNHDSERRMTRAQVYSIVNSLPYCVNRFYNKVGTQREGDFAIPIQGSDGKNAKFLLYLFDSNDYNADDHSYAGLQKDQVEWYKKRSNMLKAVDKITLPALAFLHVPLNEYTSVRKQNDPKLIGVCLEDECPGRDNSGMFDAMVQQGDVIGVFAGHDHVNDYIGYKDGIALGYGRFSGTDTYQDLLRGARVFELTEGVRGFDTWIRIADGEVLRKASIPGDFQKTETKQQ